MINNEKDSIELAKNQMRSEVRRYVKQYVSDKISEILSDEYEYDDEEDIQVPEIQLKSTSGAFITPSTSEIFGTLKVDSNNNNYVDVRGKIVDENEDVDGWEIKYWEIVE